MKWMRTWGRFGVWPSSPLGQALFFEIFGSGNFGCGALRGVSRSRGRGWNRLRGGFRLAFGMGGAGRTGRNPAPHRRLGSIRGWPAMGGELGTGTLLCFDSAGDGFFKNAKGER